MSMRWNDTIRILLSRCVSSLRKAELDAELDEELSAHIELAIEENLARGMSRRQARQEALRAFGGLTQARESHRLRRGFPLLDQLMRDLRFGVRQLYRAPGFALTAILTLALGLGANTAVFSLINALLLRPLPAPHAEQLSVVRYERSDDDGPNYVFSAPMFRSLEKRHDVFRNLAAFSNTTMQVRGSSGNMQIPGVLVSGEFFAVMETPPLLGRTLTPQDDRAGRANVVVLSEGFWQSRFNRAPDIVGRTLTIANAPFTVVGVMPRHFFGADPTQRPSVYLPLPAEPLIDAPYDMIASGEYSIWLRILARRKAGISLEQANAAVQAASPEVLHESVSKADSLKDFTDHHFRLAAEPGDRGYTFLRTQFEKPLVVVFCLCCGMLLLACLNLASLLMARAAARERELATRLALGASRRRLIQQLLMESLLIALLGTAAGMTVSPLVSRALAALLLGLHQDSVLDTSLDLRVYLFAALITAMATVLIGLLPALRATSGELNEQIKSGSHARAGSGIGRGAGRLLPRLLISAEVGLALMLVVGAGLLAASLTRLYRTGLGFDPKSVVNLELDMDKQSLQGSALTRWYQNFAEALSHHPGVETVSFDLVTPLSGRIEAGNWQTPLSNGSLQLEQNQIAPNYFAAMHIPIHAGRDFQWSDTKASGLKIILNEAAAARLFPGRSAIGQSIRSGKDAAGKEMAYEVIAVVGDIHYISIRRDAPPGAYFSITQSGEDEKYSYTAVVRMHGPVGPLADAARTLAARMAPEIPAPVMTTMSEQLDDSISSERMMAMLSVFFAGCALLVTAIGLYGTLAYATARRTSEIGVRMALGAQRGQVVGMVFRENAWVALSGCIAGLAAALLASRALQSFLYGTSVRDPWVMIGSVAALGLVASAASLLPALRAATIEPMVALRTE